MAHCKHLIKRDGSNVPTVIHGPLDLKFYPLDEAKAIVDCLENQFTPHELYDVNHEERVRLEFKLCSKL
jgi:hypothetical protein